MASSRGCRGGKVTITRLPNLGREGHTWLTHLFSSDFRFGDVTVFFQVGLDLALHAQDRLSYLFRVFCARSTSDSCIVCSFLPLRLPLFLYFLFPSVFHCLVRLSPVTFLVAGRNPCTYSQAVVLSEKGWATQKKSNLGFGVRGLGSKNVGPRKFQSRVWGLGLRLKKCGATQV